MACERDAALARAPRDGEISGWRQARVHFHEVDAQRHERIDGGAALLGRAREEMWNRDVATLEVRT